MRQPVRRGFTLIELLLVVFIIAVLGAVALPRFAQATARQQLDAAANRVISDFKLAQARARATNLSVTLTYSLANDSYQFNAVGGEPTLVVLSDKPYQCEITAVNFGGQTKAAFNGYGIPTRTGSITIKSGDNSTTINLQANGEASR